MGNGFVFVGHCVTRVFKAVGHAYWQHVQETGYIMAKGMLPDDETAGMTDPLMSEYVKNHS